MSRALKKKLESIYKGYNKREFVDPDPLLFLYDYPDTRDREIAGLIAACLAYGRVEMIMKSVGRVLDTMGASPFEYLTRSDARKISSDFKGFKYRFAGETHICALINGIRRVVFDYGSLEGCFLAGTDTGETIVPAGLSFLTQSLDPLRQTGHLLADPLKTSACKRSHLYLRWMVREDGVDPGGWKRVAPDQLIIPLDTHMYRIGTILGFTRRKNPDRAAALEVTQGFRKINEKDPVKYDFSLTRFGIRRSLEMDELEKYLRDSDLVRINKEESKEKQ
ncbi:TIGR02757 family protein [Desulfospira joergensenii]|uniref:TIGR02757 family protein n=1 Tax=Desulfospira joergensenii TaxID=53329 RepID=UPI001FC9006F|nr:TIGR02757 family protein [Desulfospira joergensenii]